MGSFHPCRSIPNGTPAGQCAKAFPNPLAPLLLPVMMGVGVGDMWAAQYLCPWSFTKDTAGPGPHGAGERHVQYLEGFLGTVGGLGDGILSHVQYLCFFLDVYLPKHLFMRLPGAGGDWRK